MSDGDSGCVLVVPTVSRIGGILGGSVAIWWQQSTVDDVLVFLELARSAGEKQFGLRSASQCGG